MKKIYYGFDVLKFLMAMLIVATHSELFVENDEVFNIAKIIYEVAVPTFFAISTYLYCKKIIKVETDKDAWMHCWKDTKRLLLLGMFWVIADLPMTYDTFFSIANLKEMIYCLSFTDPIRGLWFIKALVINKIILCAFRSHLKTLSTASFLIFVLFSLGYTPLLGEFSNPFHPYFNFYFHTFFCCIGALFAKYEWVSKLRLELLGGAMLILFVWRIFDYDYAVIAFRTVCPFFLINLSMRMPEPMEMYKPAIMFMRQTSILVYFLHFNLLWLMSHFAICQDNSILRFTVALVGSVTISVIILRAEKIKCLRWLNYSH